MINTLRTKLGNQRHYYKHLQPKQLNAVFVVSTGRTGTKFVEHFLESMNPHVYGVHEPRPDFFELGIQKYRNGQPTATTIEQIRAYRVPQLRSLCAQRITTYVESNPFASLLLPEILAVFPKAKFLIITRDSESYMRSALNKSPLDDGAFYLYDDNDRRKRISAPDIEGDPHAQDWATWDRRQKIAWYWNWCNHQLLDFAQAHPERCQAVAYEALFSKTADRKQIAWKKVLEHMGQEQDTDQLPELLRLTQNKKNATQAPIFEGVEAWTAEEQAQFRALTQTAQARIDQFVHQHNSSIHE